jgi:hypothetical protein
VTEGHEPVDVPGIQCLIRPSDDLHVLLRHRPPSIPQAQRGDYAASGGDGSMASGKHPANPRYSPCSRLRNPAPRRGWRVSPNPPSDAAHSRNSCCTNPAVVQWAMDSGGEASGDRRHRLEPGFERDISTVI